MLAAAIVAHAQVIVSSNIRAFPAQELAEYNVEAKTPDDFVLDQISIDDRVVFACVQDIANCRARPHTAQDILAELENTGLVSSAGALSVAADLTIRFRPVVPVGYHESRIGDPSAAFGGVSDGPVTDWAAAFSQQLRP